MDMDAILDLVVTGCAALGVLFMQLGVGTSIDLEMVRTSFRAPVSILIGFACQFGMMPALAYTACILADFEGYTAIGLILICSAPGGTMSNAVVLFAGGDAALSVMMTLCSSVLAFGVWPALTVLYSQRFTVDQDVNIPLEHIVLSVAMSCVPVPIGAYLQIQRPKWGAFLRKYMVPSMVVTIGPAVVAQIIKQPTLITELNWRMLIAVLVLNHVGFCVSYVVAYSATFLPCCAITHKQARTVPFESAMQNGTLAVAVIVIAFDSGVAQEQAMVGPAYYLSAQMTILVYMLIFRKIDRSNLKPGEIQDPFLEVDEERASRRSRRESFPGRIAEESVYGKLPSPTAASHRRAKSTHSVPPMAAAKSPTPKWSEYASRVGT